MKIPFASVATLVLMGMAASALSAFAQQHAKVVPGADPSQRPITVTQRILPENPLRLGGVYTSGLAGPTLPGAVNPSAGKLSPENRDWIAMNCDVVALRPSDIDEETFPAIIKFSKLFTPLLYLSASSLYETSHPGTVGDWRSDMKDWTLKTVDGHEAVYPDKGGHWMDFASEPWANYWTDRATGLTGKYGAFGVVAAELPLGNTFVSANLQRYHTAADRAAATEAWLSVVRRRYRNLLIPSAVGFDLAAGHATPDPKTWAAAPALIPRLWNDYFGLTDGAWCEGWIHPYWNHVPLAETLWETQMEAVDRAGRLGQVFIAGAAYRNDGELEFAVASFLLVEHNQGRAVFQPMPIRPGEAPDAGFNLAVLRREVREKPQYFRIPLGRGMQERHQIPAVGGPVWRRNFQFGDVYVNSDESATVTVQFAGDMQRLSGEIVRRVVLPPHSGAVLLYSAGTQPTRKAPRTNARPVGPHSRRRRP